MKLSAFAVVVALASTSAPAPAPAVLVAVSGQVGIESKGASRRAASLGMRLDVADRVVLEPGATAEVYLAGGEIVHLRDAARFEIPKAGAARPQGGGETRLGGGSISKLESGLWVLQNPSGSLLVSPMRGDDAGSASESGATPLSPRYEALDSRSVRFVWDGGPPQARVVVARKREVLWRSAPSAPRVPVAAASGLTLEAGQVYTWWLESADGAAPLCAGITFRAASDEELAASAALERDLDAWKGGDAAGAADFLRIAHFAGAASWSRVVALASRLPEGEARTRALDVAAAGLRLNPKATGELATILAASN